MIREMKDSGIEWIGEIPKEWKVCRIKELFHEVNERCENGNDFTLLSVSEYYGVSLKSQRINEDDMLTHAETLDGYKVCKPDDIVMNIMLAWKRALGISNFEGIVSPAYCVYRANAELNAKYFHYLYRTDIYANLFKQFSTGIIDSRLRLYPDKFLSLKCQFPPLDEQCNISAYLDTKCTKIDSIIEKQEKVIEKLKAYKLSVITEAVTKGLNPDAKMKDSGVEFLGEVPENWEVIKFGRCITIKSNLVPPENYYDYPQIAPDSIEKNSARLLYYKTVRESGVISWNHLFYKGQIIYSKIRPLLNKVIIAPFDGLCSADMYPIETENNSKFIVYVILSDYFSAQVGLFTENRVKMPKINQNELSGIIVAMPELEEQQQIAAYLDKKCSAIDSAIEKKQAIIEKLKEYKKSLIYEVVTGKKEV